MERNVNKPVSILGLALCLPIAPVLMAEGNTTVEYLSNPAAASARLPFSEAVRVGSLLFLSGQLGVVPGTMELVPGGIQAETRQTLENIKATLTRQGSSMERVVKCTVFLADMSEWKAMNEVYVEYFPVNLPARSAFGAAGLALGARTEIECIATVSD